MKITDKVTKTNMSKVVEGTIFRIVNNEIRYRMVIKTFEGYYTAIDLNSFKITLVQARSSAYEVVEAYCRMGNTVEIVTDSELKLKESERYRT